MKQEFVLRASHENGRLTRRRGHKPSCFRKSLFFVIIITILGIPGVQVVYSHTKQGPVLSTSEFGQEGRDSL